MQATIFTIVKMRKSFTQKEIIDFINREVNKAPETVKGSELSMILNNSRKRYNLLRLKEVFADPQMYEIVNECPAEQLGLLDTLEWQFVLIQIDAEVFVAAQRRAIDTLLRIKDLSFLKANKHYSTIIDGKPEPLPQEGEEIRENLQGVLVTVFKEMQEEYKIERNKLLESLGIPLDFKKKLENLRKRNAAETEKETGAAKSPIYLSDEKIASFMESLQDTTNDDEALMDTVDPHDQRDKISGINEEEDEEDGFDLYDNLSA